MSDFKNSKTFQNLANAFAGESQARNRYTFWASTAKKEGYREIEEIFLTTADQEREHAKVFYKHICELLGETPDAIHVNGSYGVEFGDTEANLKAAAAGENEEWSTLYPQFAQDAKDEGYDDVARSFKAIIVSEHNHEHRYLAMLKKVQENKYFESEEPIRWYCMNCGYIAEGKVAPEICPACKHPRAHFQRLVTWYNED